MEPKTSKRIVSKGVYAVVQSVRAVFFLVGCALSGLALPLGLVAIVSVLLTLILGFVLADYPETPFICVRGMCVAMAASGLTYVSWRMGKAARNQSFKIDPGVPLTRANTADLSAPDSLVRASEEPLQAQESILLRAATAGQEKHKEQLVRAFKGQEENEG